MRKTLIFSLIMTLMVAVPIVGGCTSKQTPEEVSLIEIHIGNVSGSKESPRLVVVNGELIFPTTVEFRPKSSQYGLALGTGSAYEDIRVRIWVQGREDYQSEEGVFGPQRHVSLIHSSRGDDAREGDWVRVVGTLGNGGIGVNSLEFLSHELLEKVSVADIAKGLARGKPDKDELVEIEGQLGFPGLTLEKQIRACKFSLSSFDNRIIVWIREGSSPNQVEVEGSGLRFTKLTVRNTSGSLVKAGDTVKLVGWLSSQGELAVKSIEPIR